MSGDGSQTFQAAGAAYDAHIGRYGSGLAQELIERAGVSTDDRVLDVGCGTGLLTAALASFVGEDRVSAADPSEPFVDACRRRVPGADVRVAAGEDLPFDDSSFDCTLSQLAVNFMDDPHAGVLEMRRVTRAGGTVAACVWDYAGDMTLLRTFWDAVVALDPAAAPLDEGVSMSHCQPESLAALWTGAALQDTRTSTLRPSVAYSSFEELWTPFLAGVGPSGAYVVSLDPQRQEALRDEFYRRLDSPVAPFVLAARAWAVTGRR